MTQIYQIITDALAGLPETDVAILAREVVRLREAPAVVVPEIADDELRKMILSAARRKGCIDFDPEDVSDGDLEILREIRDDLAKLFHAIPADRVLGEGEIKMEICERDCREDDEDALEVLRVCGYGQQAEMLEAAIKAHDLRANQGGAAT